ncbi:CdaR family protein [Sporosarcina sp. FSL K6-1522]|uniref:CdaR family protein n=1 Tax=Sporosarcina sp. FSL K6-1522 TaxID=2921554 RepID=UPI003159E774
MDKFMDSPWFLRLTALALAILLFFSVQADDEKIAGKNAGDTEATIEGVPVEVYYDEENLVVTGVPETVDVTIDGPANIVQSTKLRKDFTLRVDLRDLLIGEHTVRIEPENLSDKLQVQLDPAVIDVVIEEKITQTFKVEPELNQRLLAEDYSVVKMEVEPKTIEVTGPKSVIDSISFVKASVVGEPGIMKSFEQQADVRVLDRDLNKLNVTIVPEKVTVKVEVEEYHKELPIVLTSRGAAGDGVTIDSITTDEKTIVLYGSRKVLDQMKEFSVDVDITEVKENGTKEIDLKKPKGISRMSLDKLKVKLGVAVSNGDVDVEAEDPEVPEEPVAKVVTIEFNNIPITVKGLSSEYKSSFQKPASGLVALSVTADQAVIDALKISDFAVYIDASGTVAEGEETFAVSVEGPTNVQWKLSDEKVTMMIELA